MTTTISFGRTLALEALAGKVTVRVLVGLFTPNDLDGYQHE